MPVSAEREVRFELAAGLHPIVRLLLASPEALRHFGTLREVDAFVAELQLLAGTHGIELDEPLIRTALRPVPLGFSRFASAPLHASCWPGPGWLPARSVGGGPEPAFDWLWFGPGKLSAPFFEDEVRRAEAMPLNWLLRTRMSLGDLIAGAHGADAPPVRGLILHMSRCGSTLLAQMLGTIAGAVVTSEPEPLDAVLRWIAAARPPAEVAGAAIRAMAAALGRRSAAKVAAHVIKLEVWHTFFLPELREALPDVPWTYLHRDPVEVLVSQLAQPGLHIVPGALDGDRIGIDGFDSCSHIDYAAQVLGRCVGAAIANWKLGGGLAIDYRQIASSGAIIAAQHFSLTPTRSDHAAMAAAAQRDAKAPEAVFASDTETKQAQVSPEVRAAAERWIAPSYNAVTSD